MANNTNFSVSAMRKIVVLRLLDVIVDLQSFMSTTHLAFAQRVHAILGMRHADVFNLSLCPVIVHSQ